MSPIPRQLALALDHAESYAREDFLSGPGNEGALTLIDCWPDWPANADRAGRARGLGQNPSGDDLGGGGRCARRFRPRA